MFTDKQVKNSYIEFNMHAEADLCMSLIIERLHSHRARYDGYMAHTVSLVLASNTWKSVAQARREHFFRALTHVKTKLTPNFRSMPRFPAMGLGLGPGIPASLKH